jgi:hypothetical protein
MFPVIEAEVDAIIESLKPAWDIQRNSSNVQELPIYNMQCSSLSHRLSSLLAHYMLTPFQQSKLHQGSKGPGTPQNGP